MKKLWVFLFGLFATAMCLAQSATITGPTTITINATGGACPAGAGTLNLNAKVTRSSGTSPLLVFFDATATTESNGSTSNGLNFMAGALATTFQHVTYVWNFKDTNPSGTGTSIYGSNGTFRGGVGNSLNYATGGVAAHLYITADGSGATTFNPTVTATDPSGNSVTCTLAVTVTGAATTYPGTQTVCVSSSGTPVAGAGGCPVGAAVKNSATYGGALPSAMTGLRYLFKCGDTFAYSAQTVHGNGFRIGSYGSPVCAGTQTNLPIMQRPETINTAALTIGSGPVQSTDGVVQDIDCEGTGTFNSSSIGGCLYNGQDSPSHVYPKQITWYNILSNHNAYTWQSFISSETALVNVVMNEMGFAGGDQGAFFNLSGNQCTNGSSAYNCGGTGVFDNINYNAILNSHLDGATGIGSGSGPETVRISACRLCVLQNSDFLNATTSTAVLKLHDDFHSSGTWGGQYLELVEASDNYFAAPEITSGCAAQLVEVTPENNVTDERNRALVIERNIFIGGCGSSTLKGLALSANYATVRDNIGINGNPFAVQRRGVEWNNTAGATSDPLEPQLNEVYNNTCYNVGTCALSTAWTPSGSAGNNNIFVNNLVFNASGGSIITAGGSGNTTTPNTTSITSNPGFNGGGTANIIGGWAPSANYGGALNGVPVLLDALGDPMAPIWPLGALQPATSSVLLTMPTYPNLYGTTYVSGANGSISPTRGQTQIAPKALPPGAVYPLAERANPYAGAGNDTYYWPNTWAAGAKTGFTPTNAAGHSQLSIQPQGNSPTTTFQFEGSQFGAYMLGSDASTSTGRPQFTLQQNFFDNPVSGSPSPGPVLFTGPSVTLYNSITLEARTYVPAASAPDTTNSPYIQLGLGLIPTPVPSPRSWELDIFVTMLAGASENQAVHSFFITQGPPDAYVIVLPFAEPGTSTYATFTSGTYQTGAFGPTTFSWSVSYLQMQAIINYICGQSFGAALCGMVPENFTLYQDHINAEQPNISTIAMGWNVTNWGMVTR
jgi:hypothetical protein